MTIELGTLIAVASLALALVWREVTAAEARGRLNQRMDENEADINRIGAKIRAVEQEQSDIRQTLVRLETGQDYIIQTLNELRKDQKDHERHSRGAE